jgi:hypothetical protein
MNTLRDLVIYTAPGGVERAATAQAHMLVGGVAWSLKQQAGLLDDSNVRINLHRQFASHLPFGKPGPSVSAYRAAIETDDGEMVAQRFKPRAAFAGHTSETPWEELHLVYFAGYGMWTYLHRRDCRPAAHYSPGHREFDGIIVPTKRRVYSVAADGTVLAERVLVSISLDQTHSRLRKGE